MASSIILILAVVLLGFPIWAIVSIISLQRRNEELERRANVMQAELDALRDSMRAAPAPTTAPVAPRRFPEPTPVAPMVAPAPVNAPPTNVPPASVAPIPPVIAAPAVREVAHSQPMIPVIPNEATEPAAEPKPAPALPR